MKLNWILSSVLLVVVGFLIYANALSGEFQFDDKPYIVYNQNIHDLNNISQILNFQKTRFIGQLSFALDYHFHKKEVFGYHLENILIHILNGLLVLWLARQLLQLSANPQKEILSLAIAALFLVHPVQTQAVAYITQRFASLATLFYLSSICCYIRGRTAANQSFGIFYGLSIVSAIFGVFTKEITFTLPLVITAVEFYFLKKPEASQGKNRFGAYSILAALGVIALCIPLMFSFNMQSVVFRTLKSSSHTGDVITSAVYFLTQFKVFLIYLGLLIYPANQHFDYDVALSKNILDPMTALGILIAVGMIVLAVFLFKKQKLIFFGIVWYFLTSLVESSVIPIPHVIFEHRLYLPSIGLFIASVVALSIWIRNFRLFIFIVFMLILNFSVLTILRNEVWKTEVALWQDNVKKTPFKVRPYNNLSAAYLEKGAYQNAQAVIYEALKRGLESVELYCNLGEVYFYDGRLNEAKFYFEKALALNPNYVPGLASYGAVLLKEGNKGKAKEVLIRAVVLPQQTLKAAELLANIFHEEGDVNNAVSMYEQILKKYPRSSVKNYIVLANIYRSLQAIDRSRATVNRGLAVFKNNPELSALSESLSNL